MNQTASDDKVRLGGRLTSTEFDPFGDDFLFSGRPLWDALFEPGDAVEFRAVLKKKGEKKARVVGREFGVAEQLLSEEHFRRWARFCADRHACFYFGVAPRFRAEEGFGRSCQVRKLRCIWADLDDCTPDEAVARVAAAEADMPQPTVVVVSGSGTHLYWLLFEDYVIDDAGDPPAIFGKGRELYTPGPGGERVPFKAKLSPKADEFKRIVGGVADLIGGCPVIDLSRCMGMPGTMNRKFEADGRPPQPRAIHEYRPQLVYDIGEFRRFARAPKKVAGRPAPVESGQRPAGPGPTPGRMSYLEKLRLRCAENVAGADDRSKAEFDLTCLAIRWGMSREAFKAFVEGVGKFGERGDDYFDLTWDNATEEVLSNPRPGDRAAGDGGRAAGRQPHAGERPPPNPPAGPPSSEGEAGPQGDRFANHEEVTFQDGKRTKTIKRGYSAELMLKKLREKSGGWPRRVGSQLFVPDPSDPYTPLFLQKPPAYYAYICSLYPNRHHNPVLFADGGTDLVSVANFYAYSSQNAECYEGVEPYPHWPPLPGHYYMHRPLQGGDGRALAGLLAYFNPATELDGHLLLAAVLTMFCGVPNGSRPAILATADDQDAQGGRGMGKTEFCKKVAGLVGGTIDLRPEENNFSSVIKRLLSPQARATRCMLLDNIKMLKFSWADVEGLITSETVSGPQLYVGEGTRPNTFTTFITVNGPGLSKDMAQRCVIIKLARPTYSGTWDEEVTAYVEKHRWAIIGDAVAILKGPAKPLAKFSRWAAWERLVLARVPDPADCQAEILKRQDAVDEDQAEADLVRDAVVQFLRDRGHDPENQIVLIPSQELADVVNRATGDPRPVNKVSRYVGTLGVKELRKANQSEARGWRWVGPTADPTSPAKKLNEESPWEKEEREQRERAQQHRRRHASYR